MDAEMRAPGGEDAGSGGDARRYWEWRSIVWMVVVEMHGVARRVGGGDVGGGEI